MSGADPRRVLAVRVGRMGDLVMLTPAMRMLLDGLPGAEVEMLTTAEGRRVMQGFDPRLTTFHLHHRRFAEVWLGRDRLRGFLAQPGFDRVYLFEGHRYYRRLVQGVAPTVFALDDPPRSTHYAARCLDVVEPTLVRPVPRGGLTLPVTDAGRAAARAYVAAHGLDPAEELVGLHCTFSETSRGLFASGRGRKHREWPMAECGELARRLVDWGRERGRRLRPVVDALPEEREAALALRRRSGDVITVLSGPPDFERYKALLASLRLLVTPNTGPMHVAAAVGAPVVALFSGWAPEECGPFVDAERVRVLRAEETADADRGLAALSASDVLGACASLLGPA